MHSTVTAFLSIFLMHTAFSQTVKKTTLKEEFYATGALKKITKTTIKRNQHYKLFGNYKITKHAVKEYHENGNIKARQKKITKLGNTGKPCYEVLNEQKIYNEAGRLLKYHKSQCDGRKEIIKEYHPFGGLVFKQKTKRK